ncbi:MAG: ShlB/FhaC/HecB family hemolysin secretion/activation protein [Alphaproteobacteria bacterium]|nr:ShlB/FhaC/HecB family hemolysin secretion/activation protein [Alphaproteobacteria bacterium]
MRISFNAIVFSLLAASALSPALAFAQQAVTGTTDAGRVERNLQLRAAPGLPAPQAIDVKPAAATEMPAGAETMSLVLNNISVDGMTVYSESDIRGLYADKIGQTISLADVYGIAAALTAKYRNDGYILTQVVIPPQTIDGGNVKFQAVEGYVDQVIVSGSISEYEIALLNGYAHYIKNAKVTNIRDLEQTMLLINDVPGLTARSVLSPSADKVGAADMRIMVEEKPYEGQIGFDNYGSPYLGENEFSAAFATNSLLGMGERIGIEAVYAPGRELSKELAYVNASYAQPFGPYGTRLKLTASKAFTEPGDTLHAFNINGRSTYGELRLEQPVIRTRALSFALNAQLDARNSETTSNIDTKKIDNIRAFRIGADLDFSDTLLGAAINSLSLTASRGLGILGASDKGDADLTRPSGDPEFTKFELEAQRLQHIYNNVNLMVGFKGQTSPDALLSAEEFGVGGASYGRGYDPSEIVGDKGIAAKAEIQWSPSMGEGFFDGLQAFGFYDVGRVWNKDATTSAGKIDSLASTGLGVRASFLQGTQLEAFWALPLTVDVGSRTSQTPRVELKLTRPF